jgi:BirA family transcriptional regulator, biotin operon repressor / biotin---[acetyl-CoA-carboxylase] ligase
MSKDILDILREDSPEFVSGQDISRELEITRTAVWKKVERLRAAGYEIEGSRNRGYRLLRSPDVLTPGEIRSVLDTQWLGKVVHYFEKIDSSNEEAYRLALKGASEGEIVIAESQDKGRGRLGRVWVSPPFLNLYVSVILRPPIPPDQASLITLVTAVAAAEAIHVFSGLRPTIKWPNDIFLAGRKIAGLLNEIHSETDRIHFVVLGIGVNLNMDDGQFPEPLRSTATSLRIELGTTVSRKLFLRSLLGVLEKWYEVFLREGSGPVLEAWREWAQIRGKPVKISSFGQILFGRALDIDGEGKLIVETESGERKRIVAGDVEVINAQ